MNEAPSILVFQKTILFVSAKSPARNGPPTFLFCILTIAKRHVESGRSVYIPAAAVRLVFACVMPKEGTGGSSVAPKPFGLRTEPCCIWIGVNLDMKDSTQAEFYLADGQRPAHTGSWVFNTAGFEYWSSELFQIHGLDPTASPP